MKNNRGFLAAILSLAAMGPLSADIKEEAYKSGIRKGLSGSYLAFGNPNFSPSKSQQVKSKRLSAHMDRQRRKS